MARKDKDLARPGQQPPAPSPPAGTPPGVRTQRLETTLRRDSVEFSATSYSGPIPPPAFLHQYDQIVPGAAKDLIGSYLEQGRHRQALETLVIGGDNRRANWGVWLGFSSFVLSLVVGVSLILAGHGWEGTTLGALDITAIVSAFIYGTKSRRDERERKARQNPVPETKEAPPE